MRDAGVGSWHMLQEIRNCLGKYSARESVARIMRKAQVILKWKVLPTIDYGVYLQGKYIENVNTSS